MKQLIYFILFLIPLHIIAANANNSDFAIHIPPDSSRIYAYTNRMDAFWAGETNGYHTSGFYGLTYRKQSIFDDFYIFIDGKLLPRSESSASITPIKLIREYTQPNLTEEIYFPDNKHVLIIRFSSNQQHDITIIPGFNSKPETDTQGQSTLKVTQKTYRTPADLPVTEWIRVKKSSGQWTLVDSSLSEQLPQWSSIKTPFQWNGTLSNDTLSVMLAFATDQTGAEHNFRTWSDGLIKRKALIQTWQSNPVTDIPEVNKALLWARFNMNSLIMQQTGTGIYAGLPWFDDYWGRDTFISLPGATLVNGNLQDAKSILRSFAEFQITDSTDEHYGRIPNRVTPGEKIYNTTDGTPWFISMIQEYIQYSGDLSFAREMYPVIEKSIEGALKYHTSSNDLMTHGDAETWMDAVGPDGPWSPRGNRAVEIQVLWYKQIQAGIQIATLLNHLDQAEQWQNIADRVEKNFKVKYWNAQRQDLYDHLNADGTPDTSRRPNQEFAVSLSKNLFSPKQQGDIVKSVMDNIVYPWGVASLAQTDPNFHPYHQYPPYYPKDAAYHNGIIWTWLSGPIIDGLARFGAIDSAYVLTQNLTTEILHRGMTGSIAEVTDALPRHMPNNSRDVSGDDIHLSGTFSQAWSLAEYLRTWWQDYFGIHPDGLSNQITLFPQLSSGIGRVNTRCKMLHNTLSIHYSRSDTDFVFRLKNEGAPVGIQLKLREGDTIYSLENPFTLADIGTRIHVTFHYQAHQYSLDGETLRTISYASPYAAELLQPFHFVAPHLQKNLKALQGPGYPLLNGEQATHNNPDARMIFSTSDPTGDDYGPNQDYTYPSDPNFENGMFDVTNFAVSYDDSTVYFDLDFAHLVQPGWHPEYGFQLTYAAIGISDGSQNGTTQFGQNANYSVNNDMPMQYLLYIGGGFQLTNSSGEVLTEYIPTETGYPMADLSQNRIHIAVPKKYLPQPKKWWKYTVLAGAQDDHGGAGLGEFRSVEARRSSWTGGGKNDPVAPNWYDIMRVGY